LHVYAFYKTGGVSLWSPFDTIATPSKKTNLLTYGMAGIKIYSDYFQSYHTFPAEENAMAVF
jgi:hypothetical protein